MTLLQSAISLFLLLNLIGGVTNVSGQLNSEGNDLLDEVARRLLNLEESDHVHGAPTGSRSQTGSGKTSQTIEESPSCSSADVVYGTCSRDGMVCPLVGKHSSYLKCVHSNWLAMPCAPGTMFDLTSNSCASPHDIQPSHPAPPPRQPAPHDSQSPPASRSKDPGDEARSSIQNDSPSEAQQHYGPRLVGYMDFPPAGYPPYHAQASHYQPAGHLSQYPPPAGYPYAPAPYPPAGQPETQTGYQSGQAAPAAPKQEVQETEPAETNENGHISQDADCSRVGTYRAVPGSNKYYEQCIHSGSQSIQWMRRPCPPGMVADENPVDLPCRFSINFTPTKTNYHEQDTKPKNPITAPHNYKYRLPTAKEAAASPPPVQNPNHQNYVNSQQGPPKYNQPVHVYYYQPPKKQEQPGEQPNLWNQNNAPYVPVHPNKPDAHPEERDPFKNGERVIHNVDALPYGANQRAKQEGSRYNVDWSQSGRQGNSMNQETVQPPRPFMRVVTQLVTITPEPTTLPPTLRTDPTTPVTIAQQTVTMKETGPPVTPPPVPPKPEPKELPSNKPTQRYPNYLDNADFMKILKDLATKYIENVSKGQKSPLNDKPTEESITPEPEAVSETDNDLPDDSDDENNMPNAASNADNNAIPAARNVEIPNKAIIDFDSGRYELPFIVDMNDLVLWPRDVAAGGEKTEEEKGNHPNPFYLLKLPNTAASSNEAAALAAGLRSKNYES